MRQVLHAELGEERRTCPTCGDAIQLPEGHDHSHDAAVADDEKTPWHFKLMVGMVVVYLGWRLIQLFV